MVRQILTEKIQFTHRLIIQSGEEDDEENSINDGQDGDRTDHQSSVCQKENQEAPSAMPRSKAAQSTADGGEQPLMSPSATETHSHQFVNQLASPSAKSTAASHSRFDHKIENPPSRSALYQTRNEDDQSKFEEWKKRKIAEISNLSLA
jgi:hypothetical protein